MKILASVPPRKVASAVPVAFYVYTLIDPSTGDPFYVGKGSGRRAWAHESAVRRGNLKGNKAKVARIQSILASGGRVAVAVVEEYDLEADAFEHEIELISTLSGLVNVLPGGEGSALSPEEAAKRAAVRASRILERRRLAARHKPYKDTCREHERLTKGVAIGRLNSSELIGWVATSAAIHAAPKQTSKQSTAELAAFRASKPGATAEEKRWAARTARHLVAPAPQGALAKARAQIADETRELLEKLRD